MVCVYVFVPRACFLICALCVCVCVDGRLMPEKGHLILSLVFCPSLKQMGKKKKMKDLPHKGLQINQETLFIEVGILASKEK